MLRIYLFALQQVICQAWLSCLVEFPVCALHDPSQIGNDGAMRVFVLTRYMIERATIALSFRGICLLCSAVITLLIDSKLQTSMFQRYVCAKVMHLDQSGNCFL